MILPEIMIYEINKIVPHLKDLDMDGLEEVKTKIEELIKKIEEIKKEK